DGRSDLVEPLESDLGLIWPSSAGAAVVVVVDDSGGGAVLVVDDGAAASRKVSAVAPGRGSVLAGGAEAEEDAGSAEGLAGPASTAVDGGGSAVSGVVGAGRATPSGGSDRAACRARSTSGRDSGDTPAVEKRDDTSSTPKSPRRTPVAVPRAHVTTRTRRTSESSVSSPHEGVKRTLNRRQDRAGDSGSHRGRPDWAKMTAWPPWRSSRTIRGSGPPWCARWPSGGTPSGPPAGPWRACPRCWNGTPTSSSSTSACPTSTAPSCSR